MAARVYVQLPRALPGHSTNNPCAVAPETRHAMNKVVFSNSRVLTYGLKKKWGNGEIKAWQIVKGENFTLGNCAHVCFCVCPSSSVAGAKIAIHPVEARPKFTCTFPSTILRIRSGFHCPMTVQSKCQKSKCHSDFRVV